MAKKTDRTGFMAAYEQATKPLETSPFKRQFNQAVMQLGPDSGTALKLNDNEIYISSLTALELRKGEGTKALNFLTSLADQFGVDLVLHAFPHVDKRKQLPGPYELKEFYKKHGFVKGNHDLMFREARVLVAS